MFISIDHVSLVVADIQAMTEFYRDVCGLKLIGEFERDGPFVARVVGLPDARLRLHELRAEGDTVILELIEYLHPRGQDQHGAQNAVGASHICFNVDDLDATYERMSAAGMRFVAPPASETQRGGRIHSACYAQDPEGNWIELRAVSDPPPSTP